METYGNFIDTGGGPFIVLQASGLLAWEGTEPPSDGRVVEATFRLDPDAPATDYDRACDVDSSVGVITVGLGEALILGQEHYAVAVGKLGERELPLLVGWEYANSEEAVWKALASLSEEDLSSLPWQEEPVRFTVSAPPLYVFDSAYAGADVGDPLGLGDNYLTFNLPIGRYKVGRCQFEPDEETAVSLYRFEPLPVSEV
jgi:hypothetical protein